MEIKNSSVLERLDNFVHLSDGIGFVSEVKEESPAETAFRVLRQFETVTTSRFTTYFSKNFYKRVDPGKSKSIIFCCNQFILQMFNYYTTRWRFLQLLKMVRKSNISVFYAYLERL